MVGGNSTALIVGMFWKLEETTKPIRHSLSSITERMLEKSFGITPQTRPGHQLYGSCKDRGILKCGPIRNNPGSRSNSLISRTLFSIDNGHFVIFTF